MAKRPKWARYITAELHSHIGQEHKVLARLEEIEKDKLVMKKAALEEACLDRKEQHKARRSQDKSTEALIQSQTAMNNAIATLLARSVNPNNNHN